MDALSHVQHQFERSTERDFQKWISRTVAEMEVRQVQQPRKPATDKGKQFIGFAN